jgi:hypothetical protein
MEPNTGEEEILDVYYKGQYGVQERLHYEYYIRLARVSKAANRHFSFTTSNLNGDAKDLELRIIPQCHFYLVICDGQP